MKRVKTKIERVKKVVENPRTGLVPRTREQGLTFVFKLLYCHETQRKYDSTGLLVLPIIILKLVCIALRNVVDAIT